MINHSLDTIPMDVRLRRHTYTLTVSPEERTYMSSSEATTKGIRVRVEAEYCPERSQPFKNAWFFLYTVEILNEGQEKVQLISRHWIITDAREHIEHPGWDGSDIMSRRFLNLKPCRLVLFRA